MSTGATEPGSGADEARRTLTEWKPNDSLVTTASLVGKHGSMHYRRIPDKSQLGEGGLGLLGDGWAPDSPLITADTRVVAIGSCFARYFVLWLAEHGFNKSLPDSPYNALTRVHADFENAAAIAQQFRWAFDELDSARVTWVGKDKEVFEATAERAKLVRDTLMRTDVLIITLGLSEVWYDRVTGEPLWRAMTVDRFDPERHVLRVESMADTLHWLRTIERLRARYLPDMKIIFTVSPVRLAATFRPVSAVSANSVSKAILRAALDEFLRTEPDKVGRNIFYFPSYEIVSDYFIDPFEEDNRHVSASVAASVIGFFVKTYCSADMSDRTATAMTNPDGHLEQFIRYTRNVSTDARSHALLDRIAELEGSVVELQRICDERQAVIQGLAVAAEERLEVINRLDAEIRARTA